MDIFVAFAFIPDADMTMPGILTKRDTISDWKEKIVPSVNPEPHISKIKSCLSTLTLSLSNRFTKTNFMQKITCNCSCVKVEQTNALCIYNISRDSWDLQ